MVPKDQIMEEIKRTLRELAESQKRTDKEIEKVNREIEKVNKMVGDLTGGWGKFVEGMVEPSCIKLATSLGVKIKRVYRRVKSQVDEEEIEVDIIIEGDRDGKATLLVVEAKSHFEPDDMEHFVGWFSRFFDFFDIYKEFEVMGVVASGRFGNGVERYAQGKGLWVLAPSGDVMKVLNPKGFKPKILVC
jgi:hypothetical protein